MNFPACISEQGHLLHHDTERHPDECVRCGHSLKGPKPLPEHVEAMFASLAEVLESSGDKPRDQPCATFDYIRTHTMQRVHMGEQRWGDKWRGLDLIAEAKEEGADWLVYLAGKIGVEGPDPDLFDALFRMYQALEAVLRYEARQKGSA